MLPQPHLVIHSRHVILRGRTESNVMLMEAIFLCLESSFFAFLGGSLGFAHEF